MANYEPVTREWMVRFFFVLSLFLSPRAFIRRYKSTRPECSLRAWRPSRRLQPIRQLQRRHPVCRSVVRAVTTIPSATVLAVWTTAFPAPAREVLRTSCPVCTSCACAAMARCSCHRRTASAPLTTRAWCAGKSARLSCSPPLKKGNTHQLQKLPLLPQPTRFVDGFRGPPATAVSSSFPRRPLPPLPPRDHWSLWYSTKWLHYDFRKYSYWSVFRRRPSNIHIIIDT